MAETQYFTDKLVIESCCYCGIRFGITHDLYVRMKELGPAGSFYCPVGHQQHYLYAKGNDLQDQIAEKQRRIDSLHNIVAEKNIELQQKDHQIRAERGAKTRIKNRIQNGVCPCCNRSFKGLRQHMKNQHPDFVNNG